MNNLMKALLPTPEKQKNATKKSFKKICKKLEQDLENNDCSNFVFFEGMEYKGKKYSAKIKKFI
jgi:hypothetical protein